MQINSGQKIVMMYSKSSNVGLGALCFAYTAEKLNNFPQFTIKNVYFHPFSICRYINMVGCGQ